MREVIEGSGGVEAEVEVTETGEEEFEPEERISDAVAASDSRDPRKDVRARFAPVAVGEEWSEDSS